MKKSIFILVLLFLLVKTGLNAQYFNSSGLQCSIGIKNDQLFGNNQTKFSPGIGVAFDSYVYFKGFAMTLFGVDYYQNKNKVDDSEIKCKFWTFYFFPLDYRFKLYRSSSGKSNLFLGLSMAPQLMKVEGTSGSDWSFIFTGYLGYQYAISEKNFLQFQVRPYISELNQIAGNNAKGIEARISFGFLRGR
jgi:hypothetical protein